MKSCFRKLQKGDVLLFTPAFYGTLQRYSRGIYQRSNEREFWVTFSNEETQYYPMYCLESFVEMVQRKGSR